MSMTKSRGVGGGLPLATTAGGCRLHQKDPPFWRWSRAERPPFLGTNPNESLLINKGLLFYMQNFIFVMFVKFVFKKPCFSAKTLVPKDPPFHEKRRKS